MKRTKDFSTLDFKDSKEIKGGAESNEVPTDYIETGEFDVIDGNIFPRTHYIDQNGIVHTDHKIFGIIVKLKTKQLMRTGIALGDDIKCRLPFILILFMFSLQEMSLYSQESRRNPNTDNIILLPGKKFIYKQKISEFEKDTIFYFVLSVEPEPLFNETLIKYTYFLNEDSLINNVSHFWEQTLATENRKWYALHPPRGLVNEVHQLLPFPEIPLLKSF